MQGDGRSLSRRCEVLEFIGWAMLWLWVVFCFLFLICYFGMLLRRYFTTLP